MRLRGLYAITPDNADSAALIEKARQALEGGIALLQYRNKLAGPAQRLAEAKELALLARRHGVPFIVNDEVELALAAGADGAHLGSDDGDLAGARARLGARLLGASCHASLEVAGAAVRAPLALFGEARAFGVPLAAIGGITLERAPEVLRAGADLLAVISDLFDATDIAARAREYDRLFSHAVAQ